MNLTGPIIHIDDNSEDQEIILAVCEELGVKEYLKCFRDAEVALQYLKSTHEYPSIILCDVNMPKINGFELRKTINANHLLRERSVPFLFYSTVADLMQVREAYRMTVQGFFLKGANFQDAVRTMKVILDYWTLCKHPNSFVKTEHL